METVNDQAQAHAAAVRVEPDSTLALSRETTRRGSSSCRSPFAFLIEAKTTRKLIELEDALSQTIARNTNLATVFARQVHHEVNGRTTQALIRCGALLL